MIEAHPIAYKDLSKQKTTNEIETKYEIEVRELRGEVRALRNEVKHLRDLVGRLNKGEHAE